MRELFKRTVKVLGIERFMYAYPPPDGCESIGILLSDEDAEGLVRGDVVIGYRNEQND